MKYQSTKSDYKWLEDLKIRVWGNQIYAKDNCSEKRKQKPVHDFDIQISYFLYLSMEKLWNFNHGS